MASEIKVLIITGDGLNCERETAWAFTLAGAAPHLVHITDILKREMRLQSRKCPVTQIWQMPLKGKSRLMLMQWI